MSDTKRLPTYVPAQAPERRTVAYPAMIDHDQPIMLTESHLQALETIRETTGPVERAVGLAIRTALFSVIWLVLSVGLFFLFKRDPVVPFLVFCLLTAGTYYLLNGQEYTHSAVGLERHKAVLAHDLQSTKLANDHEIRTKLVDSYIRHLDGDK